MTTKWRSFLVLTVTLAVLFGIAKADVPEEATATAEQYRLQWVKRAEANPAFWGVPDGLKLSDVRLGRPYRQFVLLEQHAMEFAKSGESDPALFADAELYVFPLRLKGQYMGCLYLKDNRTPEGGYVRDPNSEHFSELYPFSSEFLMVGSAQPNPSRDLWEKVASSVGRVQEMDVVRIFGRGGGEYIRIRQPDGSRKLLLFRSAQLQEVAAGGKNKSTRFSEAVESLKKKIRGEH